MRHKPGRLITIGSFDGVHRGHAALLDRTVLEAKKRKIKSLCLTFNLPPKMILDKNHPVSILSNQVEKTILVKARGIDDVVTVNFDKEFSRIKPYRFFRDILLNRFKAKGIVVGLDFRFGEMRAGGAIDLVRWGQEERVPVWVIPQIKIHGKPISSTDIRSLLLRHSHRKALNLLGHPYLIYGKIMGGRGMGRKLGFPTTNLSLSLGKVAPRGVFVVRGQIPKRRPHRFIYGVCNIGRRPTFLKKSNVVVECHWFGNIIPKINQFILVELLHFLRLEKKFGRPSTLIHAIQRDIQRARRFLKGTYKNSTDLRVS